MGPQWIGSLAVFYAMICSTSLVMGGNPDRILLKDVTAVTLHENKLTAGRRSAPVPQLNCVGGTAKGYFTPKVVQCYNRGFDGYDVQWECQTEMDNAFKFGSVEVICEGYDYPDDPHILRDSCGLEYTIDFTKEGYSYYKQHKPMQTHAHDDFTSDNKSSTKHKSEVRDLLFLAVIAILIFFTIKFVWKKCKESCQPSARRGCGQQQSSQCSSEKQHDISRPQPSAPPPPPPYGFHPEFVSGTENSSTSSVADSTTTYSPSSCTDNISEPPPSYESCIQHNLAEQTGTTDGFFEHFEACSPHQEKQQTQQRQQQQQQSQHHQQQQQQQQQSQHQRQQQQQSQHQRQLQQQHQQKQKPSEPSSSDSFWNWVSQSTDSRSFRQSSSRSGGSSSGTASSSSGTRIASGFGGTKRR